MTRNTEKGDGKLGGLMLLVLIAAFGYAAWNVGPAYFAHWDFTDKVTEVCRTPRYRGGDDVLLDLLMKEVERRDLQEWIGPDNFEIATSTAGGGRRIELHYEREVQVLPGWKKVLKLDYVTEQPLL